MKDCLWAFMGLGVVILMYERMSAPVWLLMLVLLDAVLILILN